MFEIQLFEKDPRGSFFLSGPKQILVCGLVEAHSRGNVHADSAITGKAAGQVEHRLPADLKILMGSVRIGPAVDEIQERLPGRHLRFEYRSLSLIPARSLSFLCFARHAVALDSEHLENRAGNPGETQTLVLLPVPIGGQVRQAAIA